MDSTKFKTDRWEGKAQNKAPFNSSPASWAFRLRQILVPIDFSEESKKALRYAQPFAERFGAGIILVHIVEPKIRHERSVITPPMPESRTAARLNEREQQLVNLRHWEIGEGIKGDNIVQMGKPHREIINLAKARKVDLIVVATHGYTGLKRALLGSTTERVVRHAPCPVLVVREKENEFILMTQNQTQPEREKQKY